MTYLPRRLVTAVVSIALVLALSQLFPQSGGLSVQAQASQPLMQLSINYSFYGSKHSWMYTATNDWYQHQGNWCGIANIRAIQVYDWLYYGNHGGSSKTPQWDNSQEAIHNRLNSNTSPWGAGRGYVTADISRDFGTDPRSIAYGAW